MHLVRLELLELLVSTREVRFSEDDQNQPKSVIKGAFTVIIAICLQLVLSLLILIIACNKFYYGIGIIKSQMPPVKIF